MDEKQKGKKKVDEEDDALPPPPVIRVLKMNSPEWPFLLIGALSAAAAGIAMPAFAIIFSRLLRVSQLQSLTVEQMTVLVFHLVYTIAQRHS